MNNRLSSDKIRSAVLSVVQPLYRGAFDGVSKLSAKLKELAPFGSVDQAQHASPYGFISKPKKGVFAYFLNLLGNSQAPVIVAHLDRDRPDPANEGESIQYSSGKYHVYCKNDRIYVGKNGVYEEVVAGETTRQLLISLIQAIVVHKHVSNLPGTLTAPPDNAATFTQLKANNLDNEKILVKDGGRF